MLLDIFSSFDPATNIMGNKIYFWVISIIPLLMFTSNYWIYSSRHLSLILLPMLLMKDQASRTSATHLPGFHAILISLFLTLIFLNLAGLIPYIFSVTSHLVFTVLFALPLWLSLIFSSITHAPTSFAAGLLPGGAPGWLNPFLVLVETVSTLVRPMTLSFRLTANMSAGHIVLTLLGVYMSMTYWSSTFTGFFILLITQVGYFLFEMGIALIQAYIFCLLLSLYSDDHPLS
uniref:ATP synthase subunit a n=1 Tax=Siphonosoma cumanense TaxID=6444 RepID=A0A7D4V6A5_SIPCU|nr:ATP synthase F0 subunit 6 [Siphonosoma cumanense]QKS32602.1 ATP synthase F0 subunit 6 [Siphonosoma cumanense]